MGKNITIKSKVIIVVSVIIAIITIAAIISSYNIFYKNIFATSKLTQYRVASFLSDIVYEELRSRSLAVKSFVNSFNPNEDRVKLSAVLEEFKSINGVLNVSLAYEDGEFTVDTASINSISEDYDHKVRDWYIEGMKVADIYFSEPYQDTTTGEICLTLTYPIKKEGGVKGLMSVDFVLNVNQYLKNLPNERLDGRLYVVHNSGIIASALNKEHLMKNVTQLYDTALVNYINEKIQTRSMAFSEPQEYNSVSGSTRLGQVMPVRDYDFVILYGVDKNTLAKDIAFLALEIAIIILVISIMGVIVLYFLLRKILNPLGVFANEIYKMAENKDLSVKLQIHNNDELGFILKAINTLNQSTEDVVSEVRSSIIEVASANNQLAATMEELSATFNSQSQQVSSMVEGMENVSGISKRTSDALSENMLSLETTANATRHETEKLDNVSEKMTVIEQDTVNLSETIRHLSESSAQIGNILNVINDIANQTNLLALNAAIEAARAGEAGRGFAIVADQVKALAEESSRAAGETNKLIERTVLAVEKGIGIADETAANINDVMENAKLATEKMAATSQNLSDNVGNMQQINENIIRVAEIVDNNSAASEETAAVSEEQKAQVESMVTLMDKFHI